MRQATSVRTWDDGETTTHYWAEIPSEPDHWLEFLSPVNDAAIVQANADGNGRTKPMRATTRYLQMFSDTITIE